MNGNETDPRKHTFHYASEYRDRGYSVVPLRGKVPAIAWAEYQHRRASLSMISTWFGERSKQQFNVGIVTGRVSSLIVVDLDDHDAETMWLREKPASPLMVRTGSGGLHVYYRQPQDAVRNRVRVLGHKIDIRGEGGLVVAPPSLHSKSHRPYFWLFEGDYSEEKVPVYDPSWIEEPAPNAISGTSHRAATRFEEPASRYRVASYISKIRAISGQGGHNSTFRATCFLRDAGLSPEEALDMIRIWNRTNADPPWSEKELIHKVESAYRCKFSPDGLYAS